MQRKIIKHGVATILTVLAISAAGSSALAGGFLDIQFDDSGVYFVTPTIINNPYWPLRPDEDYTWVFTYIGETEDECVIDQVVANHPDYADTYTLTTMDTDSPYYDFETAQVVDTEWVFEDLPDGTECSLALLESDDADDAIQELTFDWYAQDYQLNIWYMGEASRDFGDAEIDGEEVECPSLEDVGLDVLRENWPSDELFLECTGGSWEAGLPGQEEGEIIGQAGIVVPGDFPRIGEPLTPGTYYMQEVAEGAEDMAKILRLNAPLSVEDGIDPGEYDVCRKVKEWNPFEHGQSVEHKWYCLGGNGLVLIQGIGGGPTESEVLVDITMTSD